MSVAKRPKLNDTLGVMYPVLDDELIESTPLTRVYVGTVLEQKDISKIVVDLNSLLPVIELSHLKRVKGKEVLLFPKSWCENEDVCSFLGDKRFNVELLSSSFRIVDVAGIPPKTKRQHEVLHTLWPCNFHCNKYLEKLCTNKLFDDVECERHTAFMKLCIEIAKYGKNHGIGSAAVVVDPKINSVVAVGFDERTENPMKHAVMVAVDNVARTQNGGAWIVNPQPVRNPEEVPTNLQQAVTTPQPTTEHTKNITKPEQAVLNPQQSVSNPQLANEESLDLRGLSTDLQMLMKNTHPGVKLGASLYKAKDEIEIPTDGPYLCTNYYVYTTHEPCVMCAMALIHCRVKRVFYGARTKKGALGSACKIHTVKDLNHHYEVFRGLLEDECLQL